MPHCKAGWSGEVVVGGVMCLAGQMGAERIRKSAIAHSRKTSSSLKCKYRWRG